MGWGGGRRGNGNASDHNSSESSDGYSSTDQERGRPTPSRRREGGSQRRYRRPPKSKKGASWSSRLYESFAGPSPGSSNLSREAPPRMRLRRKDSARKSKFDCRTIWSTWGWFLATIGLVAFYFDVLPGAPISIIAPISVQQRTNAKLSTGSSHASVAVDENIHLVPNRKRPQRRPSVESGQSNGEDPENDPDRSVKSRSYQKSEEGSGVRASIPGAKSVDGESRESKVDSSMGHGENVRNPSIGVPSGHHSSSHRKRAEITGSGNTGIAPPNAPPMSGRSSDLQVPGSSGRMDRETVRKYYQKLAKGYLSTFAQGIYRHMFFDVLRRRTYALTPPGANKGVQSMMFQIIDRKVYLMDPYEVPKNSKPFYRKRINEIIWLLSRMATAGRIRNTEFMVSIHDCVQTVNKPHTYRGATYQESIPAFTIVSCNFSDNIPFPMWEGDATRGGGFAGWDRRMQEYATRSQQAWETKESKAVFRGGHRPSMFFRKKTDADLHCDDVGRTRLAYLSQENPHELDVSVGGTCGGVHRYLQRLDEFSQQRFKYVVYAEGNCFWADRLNKQVFGPSLIVKQDTPCGQFWEPLLKPMTHYLPTDFHFNNLIDQLKWARDHDNEAREMVRNANDFANNFLTLEGIETYIEVLLQEYTGLLVEPDIKLENGAIDVTDKHV